MLYRALDNLNIGVRRYEVFNSVRLKEKARILLESREVIAPVNSPPLEILPAWGTRLEILAQAGVLTLADVLLFSGVPAGVEAATWANWRTEAEDALTIKCINCRR